MPSRTCHHWISVRPTSGILSERTPPISNVVNRVGLNDLLCKPYKANMPLFGSGSGVQGACAKSDEESSKGVRPKKDAGESTTTDGTSPQKNHDISRESSPLRGPPDNTRKRDRYALLFGVQLIGVETGSYILPPCHPEVQGITYVIILNPGECLVFTGQRSRGQGFIQTEAMNYAREIHDSRGLWIGCQVQMHCISRSLKDAKGELRAAKEYLRQHTYEKLMRSPTRHSDEGRDALRQQALPWDSD